MKDTVKNIVDAWNGANALRRCRVESFSEAAKITKLAHLLRAVVETALEEERKLADLHGVTMDQETGMLTFPNKEIHDAYKKDFDDMMNSAIEMEWERCAIHVTKYPKHGFSISPAGAEGLAKYVDIMEVGNK